jgi:Ni,Fe-hydrogenase III component G
MDMEKNAFIKKMKEQFPGEVTGATIVKEKRITIDIPPGALLKVAEFLHKDLTFRFIIASAYHTKEGFEILYHFSDDESGNVINIHVILPEERPEIISLANMIPGANWIEREMHEILGITFIGHPEPEKLISEGNWAEGVYPYRKEFYK